MALASAAMLLALLLLLLEEDAAEEGLLLLLLFALDPETLVFLYTMRATAGMMTLSNVFSPMQFRILTAIGINKELITEENDVIIVVDDDEED